MTTLLLVFEIHLEQHDIPTPVRHHGPLFHRWLPNGQEDAIVLDAGDPNAELKVWFERRGYVDSGLIKFSYERREVDPEIVSKQAILDAGPLMGLLELRGLPQEQLVAIQEDKIGDDHYRAIGKKVANRLLYPPVARFLNILRVNYGEYWIRELEKWDSREESLGSYCSTTLSLKWSLDGGEHWAPFCPDKPVVQLRGRMRRTYPGYLTEEDWQELAQTAQQEYEPSTAAYILARTHQLLDQDNLKHALIEGVSALELALSEFIRRKLHDSDLLVESIKAFWNSPLHSRVVSLAPILDTLSLQDIEHTVKAIKMRNEVVHEGWSPTDDAKVELSGLLHTVAALLTGPRFKFPSAKPGNAIMSEDQWEKLAQEQSQRH
jgi:hypothetical protein